MSKDKTVTSMNLHNSTIEKVRQLKRLGDNPYRSMSDIYEDAIERGVEVILNDYVHNGRISRPAENEPAHD